MAACPNPHAAAFPEAGGLRNALREAKFAAIASALGKSESWPSKIANGEAGVLLDDIEPLLRALGYQIVPASACIVERGVFDALRSIAAAALNDPAKLEAR